MKLLTLMLTLLVSTGPVLAGENDSDYRIETVASGLDHPWSLAFLPDGRMLVTERAGSLRIIDDEGQLLEEPVAGLPDDILVSGQAGLKEVALAPDYQDSGWLYLSYACGTRRANHTCLMRARLKDHQLADAEEIFRAQPAKQGNAHYGGRIAFLPDGTLLLGIGDGFDYREEAQKKDSHFGSIVRLNPDGTAPGDNPFANQPQARPEIYSLGHRNPQGLIYDAEQDRVLSTEHGPRGGDEVNLIRPGRNYGWPLVTHGVDYSGAQISPYSSKPGYEDPKLQWTPSIAPAGLALYDGDLFPQWRGDYLVPALAGKAVHRVRLEGDRAHDEEQLFTELNARFRDVRTGPDGAIYLLTDHRRGKVLRVVPAEHVKEETQAQQEQPNVL